MIIAINCDTINYRDKSNMHPSNRVSKENFPSLVRQLWDELKGENAMSGFRATGMYPFNRKALAGKIIEPPIDLSSGESYVNAGTKTEIELCNSICSIIQSVHGPRDDTAQPGPSGYVPPPKKRASVQMSAGEVLTSDEAAARVEAEEREKREKLEAKAEKQSRS